MSTPNPQIGSFGGMRHGPSGSRGLRAHRNCRRLQRQTLFLVSDGLATFAPQHHAPPVMLTEDAGDGFVIAPCDIVEPEQPEGRAWLTAFCPAELVSVPFRFPWP